MLGSRAKGARRFGVCLTAGGNRTPVGKYSRKARQRWAFRLGYSNG